MRFLIDVESVHHTICSASYVRMRCRLEEHSSMADAVGGIRGQVLELLGSGYELGRRTPLRRRYAWDGLDASAYSFRAVYGGPYGVENYVHVTVCMDDAVRSVYRDERSERTFSDLIKGRISPEAAALMQHPLEERKRVCELHPHLAPTLLRDAGDDYLRSFYAIHHSHASQFAGSDPLIADAGCAL